MKNWINNLLSDSGNVSAMRVMAFLALLTAIFISVYAIITNMQLEGVSILVSLFVGGAFGGKFLQSIPENKYKDKNEQIK